MQTIWIYSDGHLAATRPDGSLWLRWSAEEALGRPLAELLNQAPDLSRALLPQEKASIA